jgi:DNA methylase/Helicase conserved C-terminal domain
MANHGLSERHKIKKETIDSRVAACADLVNKTDGPWVVWCHRNEESGKLADQIPGSVEIVGSDSVEKKEKALMDFADGKIRVLITKPKIAGFGLNWQHCNQVAFVGLSDSYEQIYQAIRRCYRFGQKNPVKVYMIAHPKEGPVLENIKRKEKQAEEMATELIGFMRQFQSNNVNMMERQTAKYETNKTSGDGFELYLGGCVDVSKQLPDDSMDYSIFSPPFASLYTYSNSSRDMGNSKDRSEFYYHFEFLAKELFRIMRPGRNVSVHCMNLPTSKVRDGYIGISDFRGDLIRLFQKVGFIYHSEVVVWKDPVVAMQRTKALGLLWKQIQKDSSMNRQGIPDYVVTLRKPGVNTKPIAHTKEEFPVLKWQHYASPVWFDIKQSNTLNFRSAREEEDERHICPLQLDLIQRCLDLWSAKGDVVFSPFAGVGSEGFVSLQMNRKFVGIELKKSYFNLAVKNLKDAPSVPLNETTVPESPRESAVKFYDKWKPEENKPEEGQLDLM